MALHRIKKSIKQNVHPLKTKSSNYDVAQMHSISILSKPVSMMWQNTFFILQLWRENYFLFQLPDYISLFKNHEVHTLWKARNVTIKIKQNNIFSRSHLRSGFSPQKGLFGSWNNDVWVLPMAKKKRDAYSKKALSWSLSYWSPVATWEMKLPHLFRFSDSLENFLNR